MMIKQVLVLKETRAGEARVALTPAAIALLSGRAYPLLVEAGAGVKAGFTDADYVNAGAKIFYLTPAGFPTDTLILRVKRPDQTRELMENSLFHKNISMMGFLDPLDTDAPVAAWQALGMTTFSVDLFKSLSTDDPKNMQAAMSRIAGRLAFQDGLKRYTGKEPIRLTVIGTGPAALSAVFEARKTGIPAQVFGRQECYREALEAAGACYHLFPEPSRQIQYLRGFLKKETIVITAARTPQMKTPLFIDEESLNVLPKGAVIVDLTVNEGGSVIGAQCDQVVLSNGIFIVHVSGHPKAEPKTASEAYGHCLAHLLSEVLSPQGELHFDHDLLRECWVTHNGTCNPSLPLQCSPRNKSSLVIK